MTRATFPLLAALIGIGLIVNVGPSNARLPARVADRISSMVEKAMVYPRYKAGEDTEEGVVLVAFTIGSSGVADEVRLIESSGHPKIDSAALFTMNSLRHLPREAAGRHSIAVLQYRDSAQHDDASTEATMHGAVTRLKDTMPDVLVPTRYLR